MPENEGNQEERGLPEMLGLMERGSSPPDAEFLAQLGRRSEEAFLASRAGKSRYAGLLRRRYLGWAAAAAAAAVLLALAAILRREPVRGPAPTGGETAAKSPAGGQPGTGRGMTAAFPTLAERVGRASLIVRAKVAAVEKTQPLEAGLMQTDVRFKVVRVIHGKLAADVFSASIPHPAQGPPANVRYAAGTEYVLFLDQVRKTDKGIRCRFLGSDGDVPPRHRLDDVEKAILALIAKKQPAVASAMVEVGPPGPGEVRLDRDLEGLKRNERIGPDGWIRIGHGLSWPYTRGKVLSFTQEEVRVYVRVDGGPPEFIGIRFRTPNELPEVDVTLRNHSARPLILWCECPLPKGFASLPDLEKITHLRRVNKKKVTFTDLSPLAKLTGLTALDLQGCKDATDLSPLAKLTGLTTLDLQGCKDATDLSPLAGLTGLTSLDLAGCDRITDLAPLSKLTHLTALDLSARELGSKLSDLSPLAKLTELRSLQLKLRMKNVNDLTPLGGLARLESLDLWGGGQFADLSPLGRLTALKSLNLAGRIPKVTDLAPLGRLTNLEFLWLGLSPVADLAPLAKLTKLRRLKLSNLKAVSDLTPLGNLTELAELRISALRKVSDISPLGKLTKLESLELVGCKRVSDISSLAKLTRLRSLELGCRASNLAALGALTELTYLRVSSDAATDVTPLGKLTKLRRLSLNSCRKVADLSPLSHLGPLKSLDLRGCDSIRDLGPLRKLITGGTRTILVDERWWVQLQEMKKAVQAGSTGQ